MSPNCSKCGKEIANKGALTIHEKFCEGTTGGAPEGAENRPDSGPKGATHVKPSGADPGAENKPGFFKSIEDELNA